MAKEERLKIQGWRRLEGLKAEYEVVKGVSAPKGIIGYNVNWLTEQIKVAKVAAAAKVARYPECQIPARVGSGQFFKKEKAREPTMAETAAELRRSGIKTADKFRQEDQR